MHVAPARAIGDGGIPLSGRWLINATVLALGDALALTLAFLLAGGLRALVKGSPMVPEWLWFLVIAWWCAAIAIRLLPGWGLGAVEELRRTVLLLAGVFAATTTALFLLKQSEEISRMTLSLALLGSLPLLPYARIKAKTLLINLGLWGMRCVVFGDESSARSILEALRGEPGLGYVPVAIHDPSGRTTGAAIDGVPLVADPDPTIWHCDAAILMLRQPMPQPLGELLEGPLAAFRHVVVIPDLADAPSLWVTPRSLGGILGLEISQNLNDVWARLLKRGSDLVIVLVGAPLWIPVVIAISLLILALERETPFFVHRRIGLRGREFPMWKFRTMLSKGEQVLGERLGADEPARLQWDANFKIADDPRVTPLGRFLRRTSLDELPQLLNVLRGDMSIVGPRPLPAYHAGLLPARVRTLRESVRPGMTGLWQVSGRSDAGTAGIILSDSYYVRNWSFWLDVVILVRTLRAIVSRKGAY